MLNPMALRARNHFPIVGDAQAQIGTGFCV
jgi:hypothetical protein